MQRGSSFLGRLGVALLAGALIGAFAGLLFGAESLYRNPAIRAAADRLIVLTFFPFLYLLIGAGAGLAAGIGSLLLPARIRERFDRRDGAIGAGAATALFFFLEGLARCYECHQWYRSVIPSMTVSVAASFIRFLTLLGLSLLAGLLFAVALTALLRWAGRGRRRTLLTAGALFLCAVMVLASLATGRTEFRAPAYDPSMVRPGAEKVRLVVMDGADWDYIRPNLDAGNMPNLSALIERGVHGELGIGWPTISPYMWTTLSTGLDDDAHGLCDFFAYRPPGARSMITRYPGIGNSKRFIFRKLAPKLGQRGIGAAVYASSAQKLVPEVWDYLSDAGKMVAVVGWRYSWPATPVRGVMLTERFGRVDLDRPICYPEKVKETLRRDFSDDAERALRKIVGEKMAGAAPEDLGLFRRRMEKLRYQVERDIKFASLGRELIDSLEPDFTAVGLTSVDAVEHEYIVEHVFGETEERPELNRYFRRFTNEEGLDRFGGVIDNVHAVWDSLIGVLVEDACDGDVVILISDHGHDRDGSGHRFGPEGIIVMAGGPVRKGGPLEGATVFDITPTVLHLAGLPVPEGMDGKVLTGAFDEKWAAANPVRLLDEGSTDTRERTAAEELPELNEEELRDLKALGYVD